MLIVKVVEKKEEMLIRKNMKKINQKYLNKKKNTTLKIKIQ